MNTQFEQLTENKEKESDISDSDSDDNTKSALSHFQIYVHTQFSFFTVNERLNRNTPKELKPRSASTKTHQSKLKPRSVSMKVPQLKKLKELSRKIELNKKFAPRITKLFKQGTKSTKKNIKLDLREMIFLDSQSTMDLFCNC